MAQSEAVLTPPREAASAPSDLLERLCGYCLPGGLEAARGVHGVRLTERGEIRSGPGARWVPFTAEQTIDAMQSAFHWDARLQTGPFRLLSVTDAYEDGRGRAAVRLGGVMPVAKASGPDLDKGEIQRYLAQMPLCPPSLVNHGTLEWTEVDRRTLRVRDRADATGASVDLVIAVHGRPLGACGERPRIVGKRAILTPWSGTFDDFGEWEGLRVPTRLTATWRMPEGHFEYFRSELLSFVVLR